MLLIADTWIGNPSSDDVVKISKKEAEEAAPEASGNVLDLMERLRQSLKADGGGGTHRPAKKRSARKKKSRTKAA